MWRIGNSACAHCNKPTDVYFTVSAPNPLTICPKCMGEAVEACYVEAEVEGLEIPGGPDPNFEPAPPVKEVDEPAPGMRIDPRLDAASRAEAYRARMREALESQNSGTE